jgi:cell division protein FtsI/penicillin-binding protein 2
VANVEKHLVQRRLLPASRGRILDRRGEVLAADRASWDVLLEYDAIVGRWATAMASREIQRELGRPVWLERSSADRAALVLDREEKFDGQMEQLLDRVAEAGGIAREELDRRLDEIVRRAARESRSRREAMIARELALYGEDARLSEIDRERVSAQLDAHVVLADVPDEVAFYFQRLAEEMPGTVVVEPSTKRWRPWAQISQ